MDACLILFVLFLFMVAKWWLDTHTDPPLIEGHPLLGAGEAEPKPQIFEVVNGLTIEIDPKWVTYDPSRGWVVSVPEDKSGIDLGDGRWIVAPLGAPGELVTVIEHDVRAR